MYVHAYIYVHGKKGGCERKEERERRGGENFKKQLGKIFMRCSPQLCDVI